MVDRVIAIHPAAPPKPPLGQPCNGCGVCCLYEPCPLGVLVTRRRLGPCAALRWDDMGQHYRCGLLARSGWWARLWRPLLRRWISAGSGCDADLQVQPRPPAR